MCKSLISKFIIEIDVNPIVVIYVDLISCLLQVDCYFLLLLGNAKNIFCTVVETQRVREMFNAQFFTQVLVC